MSEQEMIDGAIAAYESGQWGEWLAWLQERGVRAATDEVVQMMPVADVVHMGHTYSGNLFAPPATQMTYIFNGHSMRLCKPIQQEAA